MNVSFPGLGIELNIDRVAIELFGTSLYWYGLIIALGFIVGIIVASAAAKKLGENSDLVLDIALICGPVGVICARLYYVVFKWENYAGDIGAIFDIRSGGLAIYGGIIGAVAAAVVMSRFKKKSTLKIFDIGAVGLITGQMIGRWGNFFNQEAFGSNTNLPWGMTSPAVKGYLESLKANGVDINPDAPVHPTFLYESLWCLMTLILLFVIINKFRKYDGQVFFAYGALYGLGRFWIEGLRTDSLMMGPFRVSQLVAFLFVVICGFLYFYFLKKKKNEPVNSVNAAVSEPDAQTDAEKE
ncbi:MAG: prolipoprotein diacylglyceryl transferase [Clostridia bacterium]|nr:prolipoprotein diacylglyceryl transferase [Clostridia bacterium]